MNNKNAPLNWDDNQIAQFIDASRNNEFATFDKFQQYVLMLTKIDTQFRLALNDVGKSPNWFSGIFCLRAHSNFLAICRMCFSGQLPESYNLMRSCLENAFYGFYISQHPELIEIWLNRHEDEKSRKKVRANFQIANMIKELKNSNALEGNVAGKLYESTIDLGAHPNIGATLSNADIEENSNGIKIVSNHLTGDRIAIESALKDTQRIGVSTLSIFELIFPDIYKNNGITDFLNGAKKHL
jgi:hypothetical protein